MRTQSLRHAVVTVIAATLTSLMPGDAAAGTLDAGAYVLTYDDALGTPSVSTAGGITTYAFVTQTREHADLFDFDLIESFAARLQAAPGRAFSVRPDASFPVWADVAVSGFAAGPYVTLPPDPGPYPGYDQASSAGAEGAAVVSAPGAVVADTAFEWVYLPGYVDHRIENVAVAGARSEVVEIALTDRLVGEPAISNVWYCPGCQYLGPEDPWPPLKFLYTWPVELHATASFTPAIHVDERFVTGVPEPATWAMLAAGLALLAAATRRRR